MNKADQCFWSIDMALVTLVITAKMTSLPVSVSLTVLIIAGDLLDDLSYLDYLS